ncbi:DEAD-box ATP-dependent RNA helicase 52C-like, partial [Salvia hispanica]|uniref:DEAD-box ATP-dependent RNA helicase 52C-like n=1 Tax=Salvia hispanica TaxID=49212 RepID=UPI0020094927
MSSPWFADPAPGFGPSHLADKFDELDVGEEEKGSVPVEAEGVDIPPPVTSFQEMRFSAKSLNDNIRRCNYVKPTPIQSHAIPVAMIGRDLMACAQTGSGKTAAFCFPIINAIVVDKTRMTIRRISAGATAFPVALILAPTRELSCQIDEEAKKFSYQTGVKVVVAYGGAPIFQQLQNLARGVDILVATPGRLVDLIERRRVSLKNVKYLALDEADRMLHMGFERQVRRIVQQSGMPPPGARQTMLFSATFPAEIKRLASDFLSNYIFLAAGKVGSSTTLIIQRVEYVPDMKKREYLINLLTSQITEGAGLTLIFVETKRGADALERWLCRQGYRSAAIHGDKVQVERERAL